MSHYDYCVVFAVQGKVRVGSESPLQLEDVKARLVQHQRWVRLGPFASAASKVGAGLRPFVCVQQIHNTGHFHRELCDTLVKEKTSLSRTKAYLNQQQRTLKERQAALQLTHKQWNEGIRSKRVSEIVAV